MSKSRKQTAVEFLSESLLYLDNEFDMGFITKNEYQARRKVFVEQAKEMEKEQIIDACKYGNNFKQGDLICEVYYNKTFKSE